MFLVHTDGSPILTRKGTGFFCSVRATVCSPKTRTSYSSAGSIFTLPEGFSRGAYQVRVISAMIRSVCQLMMTTRISLTYNFCIQVGLIQKGNQGQIPLYGLLLIFCFRNDTDRSISAYELYIEQGKTSNGNKEAHDIQKQCNDFKKSFSRDIVIHFVGAWYATRP